MPFAQARSLRLVTSVMFSLPSSLRTLLSRLRPCLPMAVWGLGAAASSAQGLAEKHAAMLKQVLSDSQVLTEQYERALARLESELATTGDYEEARLVQLRREELRTVYAGAASLASAAVVLPLERARLAGTVEVRSGALTNWRTSGSLAEWTALKISPGTYHLELEASLSDLPQAASGPMPGRSQPQEKATFTFYEVSLLPGAQENRRSFEIFSSDQAEVFSPVRIGPLVFTRDSVTLRLIPAAGYPANGIFLRNLRLVPVTDEVVQTAPSLPEADPLQAARLRLKQELAVAQKPVLEAYHAVLNDLAASALKSPETQELLDAEAKRLSLIELASSKDPEVLVSRIAGQFGGMAGFEDISNARLVSSEVLSGDHFTVEHEGRKIPVRLMWLRCAPVSEKDASRRDFAKHFRLENEDTSSLAQAAREFTLGYLEGKPLRLLLRSGKDKEGFQAALVFLPEVGLYQNVLVDQGLAAVEPPQKGARPGLMERGLLGSLVEREAAAKRLKNGAWALAAEEGRP